MNRAKETLKDTTNIKAATQNGTVPEVTGNHMRHVNQDIRPPGVNHNSITVFEQLKESRFTAIIGFILFVIGMSLLFWNEGKAVKVAHSLDEALNNVVILSYSSKLQSEYEGHLVYLSGPLEVLEPLTEPEYGIIVDSVKLKRRVQMFQWVEIKEERYDSVDDYYYTTEWQDKLIDSKLFYIPFGHENPREMPIKSKLQIADEVKIGAFVFGTELKKKFNNYVEITSDERPERKDIKMHSGLYYHSEDLWNPKVGDIRIQFSYAGKAREVYSIVGMLADGRIKPYITSHGEEILLQRNHKVTMDKMFHLEHVHNYWRTWKMRGIGWFLLFMSASYMANILKTIILNSNLLHSLIALEALSLSVSMSTSLLVIGFAWVWYRPIVGLCLALASILPFMYSTFFKNSSPQQRDPYRRL
ncbi:transmembrane protein 43 homolog isoform X2 [Belonocnema kinseyi]|uniref:transmembrane protein 43 homolog isoform X2 n=1 Tax=Belonocnema kinseyi TaxID=2817044 RepID=UPI00143D18C8|nr:transmembrane protein 43 homolog isoform X2 [Belonocnema kinseyi]